jgi:uncharacterized protein with ParB-like and HNH nuclease domain
MKTGRYSLRQLLTHNEIEQIIIPEIQRDYVWELSNVEKLIADIKTGFDRKTSLQIEIMANGNLEQRDSVIQYLTQEYERLIFQQKLGFIYAYHDRDYAGKFFLIDGQQRITTLFLMLLSMYKALKKEKEFEEIYFNNRLPKVDYKVREQSHDFLLLLISSVLEGKNFKEAEQFYSREYLKDTTIKHVIQNFEFIGQNLGSITDKNGFLRYLENFVEVNYFDTHLSEQGEQLYIYMNSRGEQLSHQEIVRAELMQKIADPEKKIELGHEWEKWQNFFWRHRGKNENADKGFEEFLKWATIIHLAVNENEDVINFLDPTKIFTKKQLKENYIKDSFEGDLQKRQKEEIYKYQVRYLHYDFLKKLFDSLEWLYSNKTTYIPIQDKWLSNEISILDYVILIPVLHYQTLNEWYDDEGRTLDVERLAMFLKNLIYFEAVAKNPDTATLDALEIVSQLKDKNEDIIHISSNHSVTKTILTDAERFKLELYQNDPKDREEWEKLIWAITLDEDYSKFLMGDITVVWKCLEIEKSKKPDNDLRETFSEYVSLIKNVIFNNRSSDNLRRLLLCKFDYLIESGSGGGGLRKYSFIGNGSAWVELREWKETLVKDNFIEFLIWLKSKGSSDLKKLITDAKKEFLPSNWREAFIDVPALLEYCNNKKILMQDQERILLLEKTNYSIPLSRELQCALLQNNFATQGMWMYENNCCVLEFDWNDSVRKIDFKTKGNLGFAMDIGYSVTKQQWSFILFHRVDRIKELINVSAAPDWNVNEDRLTFGDGLLYSYDQSKSLLENNEVVAIKVKELFPKIETLLANLSI